MADATYQPKIHIKQGGDALEAASGATVTLDSGVTFTNNASQSTSVNVGAAATGATASERGNGIIHQTVLTLSALQVAISDASVGGGSLLYTFPEGGITILGGIATLTPTTTTATTTLNASKVLSIGVGSVVTSTQASGNLATTEQDIINVGNCTSSSDKSVAGTAGTIVTTTPKGFNGSANALKAYLNIGVPTATDIDADATVTIDGTVTITWAFNGDV